MMHPPIHYWHRKMMLVAVMMIASELGLIACTQGDTSSDQTATFEAERATPVVQATGVVSEIATGGLTETGYDAPDGSPLYAECVGNDSVTGTKLPLPPPTPAAGTSPSGAPTAPADLNPNARPPDTDLPAFDVLSVAPPDTSGWARAASPCVGGLSFSRPPAWAATHALAVGGYQQSASATFTSTDSAIKVDLTLNYDARDLMARRTNAAAGNGTYFIVRNESATVGGATGFVSVTSESVGSPQRYLAVSYLVSPRANWYLSVVAFIYKPFSREAVSDVIGFVNSVRFAP